MCPNGLEEFDEARAKSIVEKLVRRSLPTLGYSPLTERIYMGTANKKKPNEWSGKKIDMTSNFIQVMLQKFAPGFEHTITIDGEPKYAITVREIPAALSTNQNIK